MSISDILRSFYFIIITFIIKLTLMVGQLLKLNIRLRLLDVELVGDRLSWFMPLRYELISFLK